MRISTVHAKQRKGEHSIIVTPGRDSPETSEFMTTNVKGEKVPLQFRVPFKDGVADVSDALGRYMVDKGHAKKGRLIALPGEG